MVISPNIKALFKKEITFRAKFSEDTKSKMGEPRLCYKFIQEQNYMVQNPSILSGDEPFVKKQMIDSNT